MKFSLNTRVFHENPVNWTVLLKLSKRKISFIMSCVKYTKSFQQTAINTIQVSGKTMSTHLVFHADPFKILEFLISMGSMTIRSHSACKETEDFH